MKTGLLFSLSLFILSAPLLLIAQSAELTAQQEMLLQKADEQGNISVIVSLNIDFKIPDAHEKQLMQIQRNEIRQSRESILSRHSDMLVKNLKTFSNLPYFALTTDREGILRLLNDPGVSDIVEDDVSEPHMDVSNAIIGSPDVWGLGYTGVDVEVAVFDTGVESFHPHFGNRVVQELCFSTTVTNTGSESLCPDGAPSAIGPGAADDCDTSIRGCGHGTHVAGTVAGSSIFEGRQVNGVARDANIIAVQVFSQFPPSYCNSPNPCVLSYGSDRISAMDWLYENRDNYNIAAVNMSLGSGEFSSVCDSVRLPETAAINLLKSINIATIASSGNDGLKDAIGAPACISSVISVGSTRTPKYNSFIQDDISPFSNSAEILDLLAPGQFIESARPDGTYAALQGTSMAAPHVAGAWALYRQANPDATVDETLATLQQTGVTLTDSNNITRSRIQLNEAITASPVSSVNASELSWTLGR